LIPPFSVGAGMEIVQISRIGAGKNGFVSRRFSSLVVVELAVK
jgi:hypothetical protein